MKPVSLVFLHIGADTEMATLMLESARRHMPGLHVIMHTDDRTPRIAGVDERIELPWDGENLMRYRTERLAELPDMPIIAVDTDVLFRADVRDVFDDEDFDAALTLRQGRLVCKGVDVTAEMPFNAGIKFARSQAFWQRNVEVTREIPRKMTDWWVDQVALRIVAEEGRFRIKRLSGWEYNYSPSSEFEDLSAHKVIHYKGWRKPMMIRNGYFGLDVFGAVSTTQRLTAEGTNAWRTT